MANYMACIPVLVVMVVCLVVVKFHNLSENLGMQMNEKKRLVAELDAFREKNLALDQRIRKEAEDRGSVEIKWRECVRESGKLRAQMTDTNNDLSNQVEELKRQLTVANSAVAVKEQEIVKVAEERKKYQDLYEKTDSKLNELHTANENLKKIADASATRAKELQAELLQARVQKPGVVVKREAGQVTEKAEEKKAEVTAREEPKKENSPAAETKPSEQVYDNILLLN